MADDPDPWAQRFQNIDKLMGQQPAAPASTATSPSSVPSSTPASTAAPVTSTTVSGVPSWMPSWMVPGGWGHDVANAVGGGMYAGLGNITSNVTGGAVTAPPLPADVRSAMQAHPYFAGAGNVIATAPLAIGLGAGTGALAGTVGVGGGLVGDTAIGATSGAAQNLLAGDPEESAARRGVSGAVLGGAFGAGAHTIGSWFGAGKSIPSEVADAAKIAKERGVTDIGVSNLPGRGDIKATGAPPTYAQAGQIDNAVSKLLGEDVPDFKPANLKAVKNNIGGDITQAAKSGQINAQPGGAFDQALTQVQQFANANNAGPQINSLVNQIRGQIKNGVISGQDFDNLVGAGSPLHNLVGSDDGLIRQSAQMLDKVLDSGFQASSPPGTYENWVDARTKYRLLMGVEKALLQNGHVNPTSLFSSVLSRFADLKGVPDTSNPVVGRMGQFAASIKTLFGGGAGPPLERPNLLRTLGVGGVGGAAATVVPQVVSGNIANPENWASPAAIAGLATGLGAAGARYAGQAYQQSRPFANALINAGGAAIANPLSRYMPAIGTQAFPQRGAQK